MREDAYLRAEIRLPAVPSKLKEAMVALTSRPPGSPGLPAEHGIRVSPPRQVSSQQGGETDLSETIVLSKPNLGIAGFCVVRARHLANARHLARTT